MDKILLMTFGVVRLLGDERDPRALNVQQTKKYPEKPIMNHTHMISTHFK